MGITWCWGEEFQRLWAEMRWFREALRGPPAQQCEEAAGMLSSQADFVLWCMEREVLHKLQQEACWAGSRVHAPRPSMPGLTRMA